MDLLLSEHNERILTLVSNVKERLKNNNDKLNIIKLSLEMIDLGNEIKKKSAISTIADFCGKQRLMDLFDEAVNIKKILNNIPILIFQDISSKYFLKYYMLDRQYISFLDKIGGDQLGNRIIITLEDGKEIIYHGKTHSEGLKSQNNNSAKSIDLKKLFVYKILEFSNIGSEFHFFYYDLKNFYIATKDAGYDNNDNNNVGFKTYENIIKYNDFEIYSKTPNLINGFIKADFISRILLLGDVINNSSNVGLTKSGQFKIIDFKIIKIDLYERFNIFDSWLSGNNEYNYLDNFIISIIKKKPLELKIKEGISIFRNELNNFDKFIYKAYDFILENIKNITDISKEQLNDLEEYKNSIIKNYMKLC